MGDPLKPGDRVGGYVLESVLGRGGMGAVFLARHALLGRRAAVKVLDSKLSEDAQFVSRFFHEAKIVNDVRHPNIVDIVDFIHVDSPRCVAYVMDYLEGPPLNAAIREAPLAPAQAASVARQIAAALRAVHAIGVVHRDLKPGNVMLTAPLTPGVEPVVKLLDFGIAKVADPTASHKTSTGALLGTPAYMAPEQVAGELVTPAADVYALGEILHESLTGRSVFDGPNVQILRAKLDPSPPKLAVPALGPGCAELVALAQACLAFEPSARPGLEQVIVRLDEVREALTGIPFTRTQPATVVPAMARTYVPAPLTDARAAPDSVALDPPAGSWLRPKVIAPALFVVAGVVVAGALMLTRGGGATVEALPANAPAALAGGATAAVAPGAGQVAAAPSEPPPAPPAEPAVAPVPAAAPPPVEAPPAHDAAKRLPARGKRGRPDPEPPREKPIVEPPKTEPPKAAVEVGRLRVEAWTTGGRQVPAQVQIDGNAVATPAPIEVKARAGKRTIVVTAAGYPPKTQVVDVPAGDKPKVVQVIVDLE